MNVNPAHQTAADSMLIRTAMPSLEPERSCMRDEREVDGEQQAAAEVAAGPAARGDPVALVLGGDRHRIASLNTASGPEAYVGAR